MQYLETYHVYVSNDVFIGSARLRYHVYESNNVFIGLAERFHRRPNKSNNCDSYSRHSGGRQPALEESKGCWAIIILIPDSSVRSTLLQTVSMGVIMEVRRRRPLNSWIPVTGIMAYHLSL